MPYQAPIDDLRFILTHVLNLEETLSLPAFNELDSLLCDAVLEEAGKFANNELAPLNKTGDAQGCRIEDGVVTTPNGFKQAYAAFIANGWNGVPFPAEFGGQGLPWQLSTAISECWSGANMAFALCPLLTQGSVELLLNHGTAAQQQTYLHKLISGQWTGTMCLTEPQAGSDVGAVRTSATPAGEHYLLHGQKIFITFGEHDYTDNIIHMVLARLPDAPAGPKGISLFIVPKFLESGERNDVKALSIEHKMGIHGSPTAIMAFGDSGKGAVGYLVGEPHRGLACMFTMMNNARLAVGVEGVAIAEKSLQQASAYAAERKQMGKTIEHHPDVKRMLLHMRSNTEAMRSLALTEAKALDMAKHHSDAQKRGEYALQAAFLTPIVKAHATDIGHDISSMAIQCFGGTGYIRETGIEQNLRDAKIAQIYEGTNGIQAIDLLTRKLTLEGVAEHFIAEMRAFESLTLIAATLEKTTDKLRSALHNGKQEQALFIATPHLKLWGITLGALMMQQRIKACEKSDVSAEQKEAQAASADYYMQFVLPEADTICQIINRAL